MSNTPAQQRIACAANKRGGSGELALGVRHFDPLMWHHIELLNLKHEQNPFDRFQGDAEFEQGFIDQNGNFLTRTEAWKVAQAAGQIIRRVGGDTADGGTLYSENLY
jgi:hypothetical protein